MEASHWLCRNRSTVPLRDDNERVSVVHTCEQSPLLSTSDFQRGCVSHTISALQKVDRSAATAGNVWTISPREPSRKTRKRGLAIWGLAHRVEESARGVIFWIPYNRDADAQPQSGSAFRNACERIVCALRVYVG